MPNARPALRWKSPINSQCFFPKMSPHQFGTSTIPQRNGKVHKNYSFWPTDILIFRAKLRQKWKFLPSETFSKKPYKRKKNMSILWELTFRTTLLPNLAKYNNFQKRDSFPKQVQNHVGTWYSDYQSLNPGSAQVQILLATCRRFEMVRISNHGPSWK